MNDETKATDPRVEAERLCALAEALDAKATPGPWTHKGPSESPQIVHFERGQVFSIAVVRSWDRAQENADMVAEARAAWPALARATRALLADNADLLGVLVATRDMAAGLKADAERALAEVERRVSDLVAGITKERDAARAEVEALQEEVTALREGMDRADGAREAAEEELAENQRIAAGREEIVAASKEALKLLCALTEHEDDGPWRPEITRLDEALLAAGEIRRSTL